MEFAASPCVFDARIVVLSHGRVVFDGSAAQLAADQLWELMASGTPAAAR